MLKLLLTTTDYNFNDVFYWCVEELNIYAKILGITYEELNVWLFVVLYPIILVMAFTYGVIYHRRYINLKRFVSKN